MLAHLTSDGKTSMTMTTKQYWSRHVAAVKAQAITTRAYAQRHGLVLSTLYYWQQKLKPTAAQVHCESTGATDQPSKFVALHVKAQEYAVRAMATSCTLVLGAGVRLEMAALPDPQWLTALARCAHGER
jgi:transposase-like protein